MFTFTNLNKYGRLGNQLFQIAATIQLARKHGVGYVLPEWPYAKYFVNKFAQLPAIAPELSFHEPHHHYADYVLDESKMVDIHGYFQSEKFLPEDVDELFRFHPEFYLSVLKKHKAGLNEPACAVHIRRGDYINNPNYINLPIDYYYRALELIPKSSVLVFSDDIQWCKDNFKPDRHTFYIEGNSEIEDLALMTFCDYCVISNSTFSWWGAYLGESFRKKGGGRTKVIAPDAWYAGDLAKTHSDKDVVPDRWIKIPSFPPKAKIDLTDVTFTIPVKFDHEDRRDNLYLCILFLWEHFKTNIIICEMDPEGKIEYFPLPDHENNVVTYHFIKSDIFHRTKMLNEMAMIAKTPFIANWDADVLIDPQQILKAVEGLKQKKASACYPYDGKFFRVDRKYYTETVNSLSVDHLKNLNYPAIEHQQISFGGAIIWNKEDFIKGGMENENFISYGPEDYERYERFKKLGFKIGRVHGPLYHINHYIGPDSSDKHEHFLKNVAEYEKIQRMSKEELEEYVKDFTWTPKSISKKQGVNKQPTTTKQLNPLLKLNFDKVYVVNLERRPERLEHAKKEMEFAKIPFEVFKAVDGGALDLKIPWIPRLTPGMLGCFESHFRIISEAVAKGYESICVFEDDVVFAPGFTEYMEEAIKSLPTDWQFCYLGCTEYGGIKDYKKKINDHWVIPKCAWGTQGYMIRTKEALQLLQKRLEAVEMQIDEQLSNLILPSSGLKYYALYPTNMVSQVKPDGKQWYSDVQDDRQKI
jgi:GR25 family glycosyltransferase involved in LPS biosynthesis